MHSAWAAAWLLLLATAGTAAAAGDRLLLQDLGPGDSTRLECCNTLGWAVICLQRLALAPPPSPAPPPAAHSQPPAAPISNNGCLTLQQPPQQWRLRLLAQRQRSPPLQLSTALPRARRLRGPPLEAAPAASLMSPYLCHRKHRLVCMQTVCTRLAASDGGWRTHHACSCAAGRPACLLPHNASPSPFRPPAAALPGRPHRHPQFQLPSSAAALWACHGAGHSQRLDRRRGAAQLCVAKQAAGERAAACGVSTGSSTRTALPWPRPCHLLPPLQVSGSTLLRFSVRVWGLRRRQRCPFPTFWTGQGACSRAQLSLVGRQQARTSVNYNKQQRPCFSPPAT